VRIPLGDSDPYGDVAWNNEKSGGSAARRQSARSDKAATSVHAAVAARSLARRDSHEIPASSGSRRLSHSRDGRGVRLSIHRSRSSPPPRTRSLDGVGPVARFLTHRRVKIDVCVYALYIHNACIQNERQAQPVVISRTDMGASATLTTAESC